VAGHHASCLVQYGVVRTDTLQALALGPATMTIQEQLRRAAVGSAVCHRGHTQWHAELYILLAIVSNMSNSPVSLTLGMQGFIPTEHLTTMDCSTAHLTARLANLPGSGCPLWGPSALHQKWKQKKQKQ